LNRHLTEIREEH